MGLVTSECQCVPYWLAVTRKQVLFSHRNCVVSSDLAGPPGESIQTCHQLPSCRGTLPSPPLLPPSPLAPFPSISHPFSPPETSFMTVSPCERYLLVMMNYPPLQRLIIPTYNYSIALFDLEKRCLVQVRDSWDIQHSPINCVAWMPASSAYAVSLWTGNAGGELFMFQ